MSLGVDAPAMARRIVADALRERVALSVVERAKLTISELVTNSVCHGITPRGGYAIVRLHLTGERVRLEVEDPGHGARSVQGRPNARTAEVSVCMSSRRSANAGAASVAPTVPCGYGPS